MCPFISVLFLSCSDPAASVGITCVPLAVWIWSAAFCYVPSRRRAFLQCDLESSWSPFQILFHQEASISQQNELGKWSIVGKLSLHLQPLEFTTAGEYSTLFVRSFVAAQFGNFDLQKAVAACSS
ncbi:unnamed protein product [Ixodes pacificus]